MTEKIVLISLFTILIHGAETLSYAFRLAGVRTRKLAVALSLTGIIVLVSRTSNLIQAPMTGGIIDTAKKAMEFDVEDKFRMIIASASLGTLIAMLLFPTVVRLAARFIAHLEVAGSIPNVVKSSVTIESIKHVKYHVRLPKWDMIRRLRIGGVPKRLLVMNCVVTAIYTVGVLAALYASLLAPEFKTTAVMSSGLINGFATIIFTILVDPQVALLTDKAMSGETKHATMNKTFGLLMISRFLGTVLAQLILIPAAYWITWIVPLFA